MVLGSIPFFLRITFTDYRRENRVLTDCTVIDALALVAAALEMACLIGTLRGAGPSGWRVGRDRPSPVLVYTAAASLSVLAVIHALRGFGLIFTSCPA